MNKRLQSITLSDFRSIRGQITVPLDAPVVLIHGQNGIGKTSILSGIELGLTGAIPSLGRVEPDYVTHLVHKQASQGKVSLTATGLNGSAVSTEITVSTNGILGSPLLSGELASFYSERCYLAQSALGRLLEIYQHKNPRQSDTPLTQFVKDLLGLDQLDAVIDGLHNAGDIRRLRAPIPLYFEVREKIQEVEIEIREENAEFMRLKNDALAKEALLSQKLASLEPEFAELAFSPDVAIERLQQESEERNLLELARIRRDLVAAGEEWQVISVSAGHDERNALEEGARATRALLDQWRSGPGRSLDDLIKELASQFPNLPSATATDPELARVTAARTVSKELERCIVLLTQDMSDAARISVLSQELERATARSKVIDEQLASLSDNASVLAQALAGISPHIHTEDCPVCGRNFKEVSKKPLSAFLSDRIAALTESAGRLQALSKEKASATNTIANLDRERSQLQSRQISDETRNQLKTKRARLEELFRQLSELASETQKGMALIARFTAAARKLDEIRSRDLRTTTLRSTLVTIANKLTLAINGEQQIDVMLEALQAALAQQQRRLTDRQNIRKEALSDTYLLKSIHASRSEIQASIKSSQSRLDKLVAAKKHADERIASAKRLGTKARDVRTAIVRRVFNDSLNAVWHDLFVRLAPEERFVPAFALPEATDRSVEAVLETIYRAGGKGGNPRAMLSAGNLNTAALTLFLALHLSVNEQLPWLVIDDPVQSMDEVHIAQFAALLRTLSKSHGRQIILAMHERPLFEYLALELSPAFADDRLITIELGQAADGKTTLKYEPLIWHPDTAIAA